MDGVYHQVHNQLLDGRTVGRYQRDLSEAGIQLDLVELLDRHAAHQEEAAPFQQLVIKRAQPCIEVGQGELVL